jgi:prolipoprotein diacylglyceryltransferase
MLGAALLFAVLLLLRQVWVNRRPGQLFAFWVGWYGLQRFLIDSVRYGSGDATVGPFTWNQVSGLVAAVGAAVLIWWLGRRPRRMDPIVAPPKEDDAEIVAEDDGV